MAAPETSWLDILTRYVLPPILGGAGGLITIWANWGIEKRKQRLQRRRELVTGWRMTLMPMIGQPQDPPTVWAGERQRAVMSSPYYASLRPHLSASAIQQIEDPVMRLFIRSSDPTKRPTHDWNHHFPLKVFVDEIGRIEKKWKLV
jgi:hypothetical protein